MRGVSEGGASVKPGVMQPEAGGPPLGPSEPADSSRRKAERNHKKRQRKKKARMAKRKRIEQEAEQEAEKQATVAGAGGAGAANGAGTAAGPGVPEEDPLSSQVSSHMTYAGNASALSGGVSVGTSTPVAETMVDKPDTANVARDNDHDHDHDHDYDHDYDYGVVKGKTKGNVFVHGNYDRYYGYRLQGATDDGCNQQEEGERGGQEGEEVEDPRISLLEKGWFHKKRCLDVGCNEGVLTLDLVKKFKTGTMMAIDLDESLVKRACVNLRRARSAAAAEHIASQQPQQHPKRRKMAKQTMKSLAQTWFVHGNVLASKVEPGSFDCITALSVTKWIHLHSGDGGIRYFFSKVCDLLAPGGKFIVEPQTWRSYKSAVAKVKRAGDDAVAATSYFGRMHELQLRPEDFAGVLTNEYGLRLSRELQRGGARGGNKKGGFDRNLFVFIKDNR